MFDMSDPHSFMGSLTPIQGLPGAAQLDMNVSCLFMHEVKIMEKFGLYFNINFFYLLVTT
jgi:hypothetical protein